MPLLIVLVIGILAFGLFDLTLGRPLPVPAILSSTSEALDRPPQSIDSPSIKTTASSEVAHCDAHDTACQLLALYHFVVVTVVSEEKPTLWLHVPQHPARTLLMKTGDAADIAILLSSLLDQRHIRNYVIVLSKKSYVLACDILSSSLRQADGKRSGVIPAVDPHQLAVASDPTKAHLTARIDAYAVQVSDAPCPCVLLDPSALPSEHPGDPLPLPADAFRYALDLNGQRHELAYSGL